MYRWFFSVPLLLILAACAPAEIEPAASGPLPVTREQDGPTPYPTFTPYITPMPPQPPGTITQNPATLTPWVTDRPRPTFTPVPPLPGLLYTTAEGLWHVGDNWQPELLTAESQAVLSPDGSQALYLADGDIWLLDLTGGQQRNLTAGQGRTHCCAQWWPARPGTIIFGSWDRTADAGDPGTGYLSSVQVDGSGYQVVVDTPSTARPAPGPDGQTIAFDRDGQAWLYHEEQGISQLDPAAYGLEPFQRIGGPSWSSDGRLLAWTAGWPISLVIFDLQNQTGQRLHPYENLGRGGWFAPPAWSVDDRWLAFRAEDVRPEASGIWVTAVDGREEHYLGPGADPFWSPDGRWLTFTGPARELDSAQVGWLVDVSSWYKIMIQLPSGLPPGSHIAGWAMP